MAKIYIDKLEKQSAHIMKKIRELISIKKKKINLLFSVLEKKKNIVDLKTLTLFFDVDKKTIIKWVDEGMPGSIRGKYNFQKCVSWRIDQLTK